MLEVIGVIETDDFHGVEGGGVIGRMQKTEQLFSCPLSHF